MFRRLGLLFAALALFSIAGGHWAVLQTIAWAGMLHDYTQRTGSVTVAVEHTFDGQHPCELCREIATAKAREHQESPIDSKAQDNAKIKALLVDSLPSSVIFVVVEIRFPRAVSDSGPSRTEQPPTPPPRWGIFAA